MSRSYERNRGFISPTEQYKVGKMVVAIAGAGGDGGTFAIQLARLGFGAEGGAIHLADPETFSEENINRQETDITTIGQNKAEVVAGRIRRINPNISVRVWKEGVTPENLAEFLGGDNPVDLLVDEMEYTHAGLGVMAAQEARARGIANMHILNVGFGAQVTSFRPDGSYTLEERLGLPEGITPEEASQSPVGVDRWLASLPGYVDLSVFQRVAEGEISAPSVAPGVAIAAGIGATQAFLHACGGENNRPEPVWAPNTLVVDAMTGTAEIVPDAAMGFAESFEALAARNQAGNVPLMNA